jgi:hypothetical protein
VWAAGVTVDGSGSDRPLIEHWNGASWSVAAVPDPGQISVLTAVTATSTTNALAVGFSGFPTSQQLTERWNGIVWSPVSTGTDVIPEGVAAMSVGNAWAVGSVIQHWNGTAWTTAPVTNPLPAMFFEEVAATSTTNAWAVGHYFFVDPSTGDGLGTAIVRWNGTTWSPVPSP